MHAIRAGRGSLAGQQTSETPPPPTAALQERMLLKKLRGVGDGGVDIFFREAQARLGPFRACCRAMPCMAPPDLVGRRCQGHARGADIL